MVTYGSSAPVITFDPATLPGGLNIVNQWTEQDVQFTTPQGLVINDLSINFYPYNETAYLQLEGNQIPLTISTASGAPFSVYAMDLAEYSTIFAYPTTINFVGKLVNGSTVTTTFVTDGIIDGNGPLVDFQTFTFPSSFSNLVSLTTDTAGISMDNVVVTIVPEPSSIMACLAGLSLIGFCLKKRISTQG